LKTETWPKLAMGACAIALMAAPFALAQEGGPRRGPPTPEQQAAAEKRNADQAKEWNANPAPTGPRDFQGIWWTRGYDRTFRPITNPPERPDEAAKLLPLTPLEAKSRQHHLDMEKAGTPIVDASTDCYPHGVPRVMASPYPIEIDYVPNAAHPSEIVILHEVAHNLRIIHLDQKAAPANTPLTYMG